VAGPFGLDGVEVSPKAMTVGRPSPVRPHATSGEPAKVMHISLLSSFALTCDDDMVPLPLNVQRILIFLSLQAHPLHRAHVAGTLWPETTDQRASANLRSALWRVNQLGCRLIVASGSNLQIAPEVRIDLQELAIQARKLLRDEQDSLVELDDSRFYFDLLPDWYDDWLVIERERFRQLRLRALECICERLTALGDYGRAIEAGLAAVAAEPMRESAHRAVVKLHLAEGNRAEAVRQFNFYRQILQDELGLAPSPQILELMQI
jgi:DNA-binding SARP family transcriptional activator